MEIGSSVAFSPKQNAMHFVGIVLTNKKDVDAFRSILFAPLAPTHANVNTIRGHAALNTKW